MKIKMNGYLGMLKDAFAEYPFKSVVIYEREYDSGLKDSYMTVCVDYKTRMINPNDDEHGQYLTGLNGFDALNKEDSLKLKKGGLEIDKVSLSILVAIKIITSHNEEKNHKSIVT